MRDLVDQLDAGEARERHGVQLAVVELLPLVSVRLAVRLTLVLPSLHLLLLLFLVRFPPLLLGWVSVLKEAWVHGEVEVPSIDRGEARARVPSRCLRLLSAHVSSETVESWVHYHPEASSASQYC